MQLIRYRGVNNIAHSSPTTANAYIFLGYENNLPGTIGIGWINTTCARKAYRTSISEWFRNDAVTAVVSCFSFLSCNHTGIN